MSGKIGFIGAGNMAEAIIKGIVDSGIYQPQDVFISDIRAERVESLCGQYKVTAAEDNFRLAKSCKTLVLAVKPQNIDDVLTQLKGIASDDHMIISIAAGVTIAKISNALGDLPIVRVMPNTPALIGCGAAGVYANQKSAGRIDDVLKIFSAVGTAVVVDSEDLIDAVTAVSGSGPAYFFLLAEEMIKAGVGLGLETDLATRLVLQTAKGAAMLAQAGNTTGQSPAQLRQKVTSPGGTTAAAIDVFTSQKFDDTVAAAIRAAYDRSKELSGA